jgi:hypothetical protein
MAPGETRSRVIFLLLVAAVATIASVALSVAGAEGDDVYTTIDVNFHHLGDHFVPTYQPQATEGTEYDSDFEASDDLESPAFKLWMRGMVPMDRVSIDYVKLYVNDELVALLNEYAIGNGSIYDIDDEVELEVSLEEGILVDGVNHFRIVTGWGYDYSDRDDIMFWNIRLVRAKPLEMACNLLSPSPGDDHLAGLDSEEVSLIVWNDRHVDALQWVRVTLDPGGADVTFLWTQKTDTMVLEPGATDHAVLPATWGHTGKDILNRTWNLRATMSFKWSFPTDGPVDVRVVVRDDQTREHTFLFEEVLTVRTALEMSGVVTVLGEEQGPLGPGSWVKGGEGVNVTVPPLVYEGTLDVHPPPGTYSISLMWDVTEVARSAPAPGETWSAHWVVPFVPRDTVVLSIRAVDLPMGAVGPGPVSVSLEVDGRGPTWLTMSPPGGTWLTQRTVQMWADLTDGDGSGPDPFSVEYQVWLSGAPGWGDWTPAMLDLVGGEGSAARALISITLPEGAGHRVRWRSVDKVGNGPTVSSTLSFGVDMTAVTLEPSSETQWMRTLNVTVTCIVTDPDGGNGGSGVDASSIEFSVLRAGTSAWSEWAPPWSAGELDGNRQVEALALVTLTDGGENYVRWRARDLAGNPATVSAPSVLMVDTSVPVLVNHWPRGETFATDDDARVVATFSDGDGSGVDIGRVEFSVSLGGEDDFGEWTTAEVTGSAFDMVRADLDLQNLSGHDNWIKWRVWDAAGNGPVEYGAFQILVNLPPSALISSPADGSRHYVTDHVQLSSLGSADPDPEDVLTFEWWSDGDGALGMGPMLGVTLSPGEHRITLRVEDGVGEGHVSETSITIVVVERTVVREPISPWLILVVLVAVVVTVAMAREYSNNRRRRMDGIS